MRFKKLVDDRLTEQQTPYPTLPQRMITYPAALKTNVASSEQESAKAIPTLKRSTVLFITLIGYATSVAQSIESPTPQDELFELSPFTITAEDNSGYMATSTLAGTRLNTKLSDVGASLSVVTEQFLHDTNAHSITDLLTYTVGTESAGSSGNFTGGQAAGAGFNLQAVDEVRRSPQSATRVRGLGAADTTQGYFLTEIPFDSYNIERVEVSRGPNAILFGLGSPAGIVNYNPLRPRFEDGLTAEIEVGSFGSIRGAFDASSIVIPKKLAIRIVGVSSDSEFEQEPTFENQDRLYLAGTYKPTERTSLNIRSEIGSIDANRPNLTSPIDNLSIWVDNGQPVWDPSTDPLLTERGPVLASQQLFWQWATIWDQADATETSIDGFQARRNAGTASSIDGAYNLLWMGGVNLAEQPGNETYRLQGFTDISTFNFRDNLLAGSTSSSKSSFDSFNASIEHRLPNEKAGIELAYDSQSYQDSFYDPIGSQESYRIKVDVNSHFLDGRENPNFGRPYLVANPNKSTSSSTRESFRATTYLEYDFRDRLDGQLGSAIGRHVFTGLVDFQEIERQKIDFRGSYAGLGANNRVFENLNAPMSAFRRRANNVIYLGNSIYGSSSMDDIKIDAYPTLDVWQPNSVNTIVGWDILDQAWTQQLAQQIAQPISASVGKQRIQSEAVVMQSYWLSDHLTTTVGWRHDDSDSYDLESPATDPDGSVLLDQLAPPISPTTELSESSLSYSAVAHLPWELPGKVQVSLHYSESENFQPLATRTDLFVQSIGAPTGKSKEYGFTIRSEDNRGSVRFNWYEANLANETNDRANQLAWNVVVNQAEFVTLNFLNDLLQNGDITEDQIDPFGLPSAEMMEYVDAVQDSATGLWDWNIPDDASSVSQLESKGFEIEAVYNPTPNWRLIANIGQQKTTTTGAGKDVLAYLESRRSAWETIYDLPRGIGGTPFGEWYETVVEIPARTVTSQDGQISPEQREWRVNAVTNYDFTEGAWNGVGVGGALRWQDKAAIGYPIIANSDGQDVSDIENPYFAPDELNTDLWASFSKTFERFDWNIKLTLRNAFSSDKLIPISAQPDGTAAQMRASPPSTWSLRNSFTF